MSTTIFVHEDPEFSDLVRLTARASQIEPALVEKDYWVTHTLWALQEVGLDVAFKGGTSLSKAFHLIQRFSEDVDVKIEPGRVIGIPSYGSVRSETGSAIAKRRHFFEGVFAHLKIPGTTVILDRDQDPRYRSIVYLVNYPSSFRTQLSPIYRPHVLLEAGLGLAPPSLSVPIDSFIHSFLGQNKGTGAYTWNIPSEVVCVHPVVTLLEKLDAITRRYARDPFHATGIIRHYEDVAHIVQQIDVLPPLPDNITISTLAMSMLHHRQIRRPVFSDDPAFTLIDQRRRKELEHAHTEIAPMFWGDRISLHSACDIIQQWLAEIRPWGKAVA